MKNKEAFKKSYKKMKEDIKGVIDKDKMKDLKASVKEMAGLAKDELKDININEEMKRVQKFAEMQLKELDKIKTKFEKKFKKATKKKTTKKKTTKKKND